MRVLWVVPGPLAQTTGGYLYDRIIVEGLRASGVTVDVCSSRVAAQSARGAHDVIVGDELAHRSLATTFADPGRRAATVLLVHHLQAWEKGGVARGTERDVLHTADRCVATSHATARRLAREEGLRGVAVVPPGADRLSRAKRSRRPHDGLQLLFVGSLVPRKGLPVLLDALQAIARDDVRLVVAGDAGRAPRHAARLRDHVAGVPALRRAVRFAGAVSDRALSSLLARADLLVLPTRLEGYGMVLAEALHAGVPALASRTGAAASLARHTGAVITVPSDDARALRRAVTRLLDHPADLEALTRRARACGAALPTWGDAVRRFHALLSRVVARRATKGARSAGSP